MKKVFYILGLILIACFFIAPQAYLFLIPKLKDYTSVLSNENTLKAIKNTILVSGSVGLLCLILGIPLSWILTRTDLPMKKNFRSWFCLPYAIPPFVGAIGWIILANPTSGVLNQWFGLHLNIYTFWGLVWVETSFLFTFVLLTALTILDRMDSSLEEAARLSGANGLRVFIDIALPLLKPAMINGFILSCLATAASFGVPALIGGPARIYLMTTQIYTYQRMGTADGMQMSIAVSAILGFSTLVLLYGSQYFLGLNKNYTVGGKSARPSLVPLNSWKIPVLITMSALLFVILIVPIFGVLLSSLSPVQGSWNLLQLSFSNFTRVLFETEETVRALSQSLFLGLSAAIICTVFSFFFNYFLTRTKWFGRTFGSIAVSIPFSTPGTVLALALILSFSRGFFGIGPSLYNTLWIILLAYIIKYMSLSIKTIGDGYQQIHPSLEEAARISGAGWWAIMRTIYWPLLSTALMASAFLVFMPVISELTMTILLTGPGLDTIGPLIFQFQEYSDVGGGGASVLSVIVISFILILNFTLKTLSKGRYGL
ncbi:iron ABC transporter permease [Bacteriovorax sp. PP10]|uniref:Iron ABC transporter permease n=1 Tax=Bacteriovorax antarcticus TaxID=3088717 RepID=A0ABU5VSG6_9BACT|nr:iron ABC transporter permease [Bacteriovorax sp. PP10]MEA9356001.1 iron ABC transporter permease [Bacteriovorax sp. PP10]